MEDVDELFNCFNETANTDVTEELIPPEESVIAVAEKSELKENER